MAGQAKVGDGNLMNWTHKHEDCYIKFTCNSHLSRKECAKRHLEAWQNKLLHGQFYRQVAGTMDTRWYWCWLRQGNLLKKTEGFLMATCPRTSTINKCNEK